MRWTQLCTWFTRCTLMVTLLAACGGVPAQPSANGVTAAPAATAVAPTAGIVPTASATGIAPTMPNDMTQARLRVSQCVYGAPEMEVYVNGKVPVDADVPLSYLGAGGVSRYEYLAPGTYRVAVVPTGMGIDKAFLGPLDVPMVAGHRYTIVALGQIGDAHHTPLLIDETAAYLKAGGTPSSAGHITINNVKGALGVSFTQDGVGEKDVPYGGFAATAASAGNFKAFEIVVTGSADKATDTHDAGFTEPGNDALDCFFGSYPGMHDTYTSASTSALNAIDFLQGWSAEHIKNGGHGPSFDTFLAALDTTGLTQMLTTGGPYLLFPPTDEAFAALPKAQLDALLAKPKVLADVLRAHIVAGYYPPGTLITGRFADRFERTVSNLLGAKLALSSDDGLFINGDRVGGEDTVMVANGTRVFVQINKVLLPATK
jgi:uncharacterized surface protein with fasciclin (FAS1) repeats